MKIIKNRQPILILCLIHNICICCFGIFYLMNFLYNFFLAVFPFHYYFIITGKLENGVNPLRYRRCNRRLNPKQVTVFTMGRHGFGMTRSQKTGPDTFHELFRMWKVYVPVVKYGTPVNLDRGFLFWMENYGYN